MDRGKYGILVNYKGPDGSAILPARMLGGGNTDIVPRCDGIISALEFAFGNHCGLIEAVSAIVIGDAPATQNGSELTVVSPGLVSISLADGDDAHYLRAVIIAAVLAGTVGKYWVAAVSGDGKTLTLTDPATMPPPFNHNWSNQQQDYPQRLSE